MTTMEEALRRSDIDLPAVAVPVGVYATAVTAGDLVHLSGHGPVRDGEIAYRGRVPDEVSVVDAAAAARLTMLNCLSTLRHHLGSLDPVVQVVRLLGFVRATDDFEDHSAILDGASQLLAELFGDRATHVRSAVGVSSLPFGIPVEIEMTVRIAA